MNRYLTFTLAVALLGLAACNDQPQPMEAPEDDVDSIAYEDSVLGTAEAAGLTTLPALVEEAGLTETLTSPGPFTVFAPSDEAFGAVDQATVNALRAEQNREALQSVLTYHVISDRVMSADLVGEQTVATVNGESLTITATDEGVTITDALGNTATVVTADLEAQNGVVHVIDAVLLPAAPDELIGDEEVDHEDDGVAADDHEGDEAGDQGAAQGY